MRLMNRARVAGDRLTSTGTSHPARSCWFDPCGCPCGPRYLGGLSPATRAQFDLRRLHPAEAGVLLILCRLQRPGVECSGAQGVRRECPNSSAAACRRLPAMIPKAAASRRTPRPREVSLLADHDPFPFEP